MADQALEVWQDAIASPHVVDLRRSSHVGSIIFQLFIWILACQSCSKEKQISNARKDLKDQSQRKRFDCPGAIRDRWNTSSIDVTMCGIASLLLPS